MEQNHTQEHIAALCAAGTLAVAATGFALVHEDASPRQVQDGGMKWAKAQGTSSSEGSHWSPVAANPVSHSTTPATISTYRPESTTSPLVFRTRPLRDARPTTARESDVSESRGSSTNRSDILRPRTADTRSTSERRDPSAGSSWLKRISTISSSTGSSPAVSIRQKNEASVTSSLRPSTSQHIGPNKLVKRSTSQRIDTHEHGRGGFLRRPATSHQRPATTNQSDLRDTFLTDLDGIDALDTASHDDYSRPNWRPYFAREYLQKRYSMGDTTELGNLQMSSGSSRGRATLILGSLIERSTSSPIEVAKQYGPSSFAGVFSNGRHRLRRSLSSIPRISRRRHFTDTTTRTPEDRLPQKPIAATDRSPISPISNISAFDVDLPADSPVLGSSPPVAANKLRSLYRKRDSAVPSDPTTLSSDNDTRIFTDDDSLEFQSDTAFDSLATRATSRSHQTAKTRKLDSIFNAVTPVLQEQISDSGNLLQPVFLDHGDQPSIKHHTRGQSNRHVTGLGVPGIAVKATPVDDKQTFSTPMKARASENFNTPVPAGSTGIHPIVSTDDLDNIDWSPKSNSTKASLPHDASVDASLPGHGFALSTHRKSDTFDDSPPNSNKKRLSIFDWSENQRVSESKLLETRPKTVHGKQAYDNIRSRSSGRKAPNQLHLRSQSVPSNRDAQTEPIYPATSKFGTWGLGHKPVSEEWGDDFEFDDVEEEGEMLNSPEVDVPELPNRGSLKSVKVPQSIIDRQASVHIQFGQVRDFMMLVEELKRLRAQGIALDLLEGPSKQLWDDAESIINLATINDDDEEEEVEFNHTPHRSSQASEVFRDEPSHSSRAHTTPSSNHDAHIRGTASPSTQIPNTPPSVGRPRGESLAQAKSFLQTIHSSRGGIDSSPVNTEIQTTHKLPFDTQDLKELVITSGTITRALKEVVRKAEGVSVSPHKSTTPADPPFSQIFRTPEASSYPPLQRSGLPKSNSAHGYLNGRVDNNNGDVASSRTIAAIV